MYIKLIVLSSSSPKFPSPQRYDDTSTQCIHRSHRYIQVAAITNDTSQIRVLDMFVYSFSLIRCFPLNFVAAQAQ